MIRKPLAVALATVLSSAGLLVAAQQTASGSAAATVTPTQFALFATGYGTRAQGGDLPTASNQTAFRVIGCTNRAGLRATNAVASANPVAGVTASTVRTLVETTEFRGIVSSKSTSTIDRVSLGDTPLGGLAIEGIESISRAYHNRTGFHSSTVVDAKIVLTPATGDPQVIELPAPDAPPFVVPGVAEISAGDSTRSKSASGAAATADAVKVKLLATNTTLTLGHSQATIRSGVTSGTFTGQSYGTRALAADDSVKSGPNPLLVMPCTGTQGDVQRRTTALVTPGQQIRLSGLETRQYARQTRDGAAAWESAKVTRAAFGGREVLLTGIIGKANASFVEGRGINLSAFGSDVGRVLVSGEVRRFPSTGVIRLPGVMTIKRNVVSRTSQRISVTAVQVRLLDGSGAVINLGRATVGVTPSGL